MEATAWRHLTAANAIEFQRHVGEQQFFDRKRLALAQNQQQLSIFKKGAWVPGVGASGQKLPVFVVGMMRSGSTLVEQILASHSKVWGAGEDSVFGSKIDDTINRVSAAVGAGSMQALQAAVAAQSAEVVDGMLQQIPLERRFTVSRIVDKQLFNFKHLGLVHLLFPDAPILHTTRNFMDVVLSTLRYNFNEAGLGWSFNLRELVEYFAM